jgi:hypothetical protein
MGFAALNPSNKPAIQQAWRASRQPDRGWRFPENRENNREFLNPPPAHGGFGGAICKFIMLSPQSLKPDV